MRKRERKKEREKVRKREKEREREKKKRKKETNKIMLFASLTKVYHSLLNYNASLNKYNSNVFLIQYSSLYALHKDINQNILFTLSYKYSL